MIIQFNNKKIDLIPKSIQVELTGKCNLLCKHCRGGNLSKTDVSLELFEKLLNFAGVKQGFNMILSGGEPLLNPYFPQILEKLETLKPNEIVVTTNGTLINEDYVALFKKIRNFKLTVQVSLDSIFEEEHNKLRGTCFAYKDAIRGIKLLSSNGIFTSIRATITPKQINEMEAIIENAISLGAKRVGLSTIVPVGRAIFLDKSLFFANGSKLDFMKRFNDLREKYSTQIEVVTHEPQKACFTEQIDKNGDYTWFFGGCTAGIGQLNMESDGSITPCALLNAKITNIKNKSIEEARLEYSNSSIIKDLLKKNYKGKCSVCNFKHHCGGCRAIPYGLENDAMGEDITCFLK